MKSRAFAALGLTAAIFLTGASAYSQGEAAKTPTSSAGNGTTTGLTITSSTTPVDLARAAINAQGGEKFKKVTSMILRGSVDLYAPNSTQSIPGGFVIVLAGDKVRIEIDARPAISFKQIYDGQRSYSSLPNVDLPPATRFEWVCS